MSLPKQFIEQVRTRASLYTFARSRVQFDSTRSKPERGQYWACCPFHSEKTPSFSIDDRKGLYYCFGCGASGNTFSFVQQIANVGFPEAVRMLAAQEGMTVPTASPAETERADQSVRLLRVNQLAATFFQNALASSHGKEARQYLSEARGLSAETVEQFGIGYAPNAKNELRVHLSNQGISTADMQAAGLIGVPDDDQPYDFFRHRIMFPIHLPGGDILGFGGRALSPQARAKYLNTRDTPVFKKGEHLYWFGPACEAARQSNVIYVVEGYMDVIAMVAAGFPNTVAPLGTALRIGQLRMAFQRVPRVTVAFDGDAAGVNAATRTAHSALAELQPGQELGFAVLPSGSDPDDLIKQQGKSALQKRLDDACPVWRLLWERASAHTDFDNPDSVAALKDHIDKMCNTIQNPTLMKEYRGFLRNLAYQRVRDARDALYRGNGGANRSRQRDSTVQLRGSPLVAAQHQGQYNLTAIECGILCTLTQNSELIDDFVDELGELQFGDDRLEAIRSDLVSATLEAQHLEDLLIDLEQRIAPIRKGYPHLELLPFLQTSGTDADGDTANARFELQSMLSDYRCKTQGRDERNRAERQLNDGTASVATDQSLRRSVAETLAHNEERFDMVPRWTRDEDDAKRKILALQERLTSGEA